MNWLRNDEKNLPIMLSMFAPIDVANSVSIIDLTTSAMFRFWTVT